ncbi:MAG: PAS domain S-box protein [Prolixibacteraceae bacterium]|nr:PAS domain S-box protein [Prolixibacteraceae bacterium]
MTQSTPLATYSIDPDGYVLSWNTAAEEMFGWRAEEIIGKMLPIIPDDKKEEFNYNRKQIINGNAINGKELIRKRKNDELFNCRLFTAPIYTSLKTICPIFLNVFTGVATSTKPR